MITRDDALAAGRFHEEHAPAGKIRTWRRNGATRTWVTRPDDYRVPVKYGLRDYGAITPATAHLFHAATACPDA